MKINYNTLSHNKLITTINNFQLFNSFNDLEKVVFIDGTKVFRHHEIRLGKFLYYLYKNPDLTALLIHSFFSQTSHCFCDNIISVVLKEIYGSCVFEEEEKLSLKMIKYLIMLKVLIYSC